MHSVESVENVSEESRRNRCRLTTVVITMGCVVTLCLLLLRFDSGHVNMPTNLKNAVDSTGTVRLTPATTHPAFESMPFIRVDYGAEISRDGAETWCKKEFKTGLAPILCRETLEMGRRLCNGDCWVADGKLKTTRRNLYISSKKRETTEKKKMDTMSSFLCKNARATVDPCKPMVRRLQWGFVYRGLGGCRSCNQDNKDSAMLYEQRHVPGTFPILAMNVSTTIGKGPMVASIIFSLANMLNVSKKSVSGYATKFLYNTTINGEGLIASMYEVAIANSHNYSLSEELLMLTKVNDFVFKTLLQENVTTAIRQVFSTGDVTVHNFTGVPTRRASLRWTQMQQDHNNEGSSSRPTAPSALLVGLVVAGAVFVACFIGCGVWYLFTKRSNNPEIMDEIQEESERNSVVE